MRTRANHRATAHDVSLRRLRATRALLSAAVAFSVVFAPAPAVASRLGTDRIGDVALGSSKLDTSVAPDINAAAGLLVTPDGRTLWSRKPTTQRAMASITKIMVALVVLERGKLDDQVTISKAASRVPYALGLQPGERRSVRQLLELALVASSNDAAYALAEHVGGSVPAFVAIMNERAAELGLADTRFANPHGLDAAGHHSSAADIASLEHEAMRDPEFRRIVALENVTLPAYKKRTARKLKSTNELLGDYRGVLGGKTGFTDDAKYSLVASAERDGITLTAVVLGARSNPARFKNASRLLSWGYRHLKRKTVATATETVGAVAISANPARTIDTRFAETTSAVVFDLDGPLTRTVALPETVNLPVFEGQQLGQVELTQGERLVANLPVVAATDMASAGETAGVVPVADYIERTVLARASEASMAVPAFDPSAPVERATRLDERVSAPVAAGDTLGEIVYSQKGVVIVRVPVVAADAVEAPDLLERTSIWFARVWRGLRGEPTMAVAQVAR